ncbi:MAG: site-2 protease family protein [Caldilineaceae bacterium]|nr:site-2 protease family protein [Caldilineaceae bacterium]
MNRNLAEFQLFDIEVKVHWSFILVLAFGAFAYGTGPAGWLIGGMYGALSFLLLFLCVTLHEFGHALTARRFGVGTRSILLLPIGGVANLERIPEKPAQELAIVIAGPLVNFAIALLLLPVTWLAAGGTANLGFQALSANVQQPGVANLLLFLVSANVLLGIFNLLPAFPLDGGRILRALLALVMPYTQATWNAVLVGRLVAVAMAIFGIFTGAISLLLIAFFVYVGGSAELEAVSSRAVLRTVRARSALAPAAVRLYNSERVSRALDLIMSSYQTDYPVLDLAGQFVGVLTRPRLVHALRELGPDARIVDVMLPAADVPVCGPDTDLAEVWEKMGQSGSRVVAVKEGHQFLGVITNDDIAEVFQVMGAAIEGRDRRVTPPTQPSSAGEGPDYA